jgi:hypothetical protein
MSVRFFLFCCRLLRISPTIVVSQPSDKPKR